MSEATWFSLTQLDAVEFLSQLAPESVDLVVTDPAYQSLEKHRAKGTTTRLKQSEASSNAWFKIFPNSRFPELFTELYRVLKNDRHLYMFCDSETMFIAKPLGEAAGFKFWKPLVWDKEAIGMGYHYRAKCEYVLFFEKGHRNLSDRSVSDVLREKRIRSDAAYPTEKPHMLAHLFTRQSTEPGELVIDPFMGSGSTGVGAMHLSRNFIGNDIADASHAHASERFASIFATNERREFVPWVPPPKRQQSLFQEAAQ